MFPSLSKNARVRYRAVARFQPIVQAIRAPLAAADEVSDQVLARSRTGARIASL
jgi:hypothetical protein